MLMRKRVNRYKLMAFRKLGATKREIIADKTGGKDIVRAPSARNFHVSAGGHPCRTLPQPSKPEQARYLRRAPVFSGAGYPAQDNWPAGYYVGTPGRSGIGLCYGEHHSDRCLRDNKNFFSERPRARARVFLIFLIYLYIFLIFLFKMYTAFIVTFSARYRNFWCMVSQLLVHGIVTFSAQYRNFWCRPKRWRSL